MPFFFGIKPNSIFVYFLVRRRKIFLCFIYPIAPALNKLDLKFLSGAHAAPMASLLRCYAFGSSLANDFTIVKLQKIQIHFRSPSKFFCKNFGAIFGARMFLMAKIIYKFYLSFPFALAKFVAPKIFKVKVKSVTCLDFKKALSYPL